MRDSPTARLGATFNTTLLWKMGAVVSDEARAFSNSHTNRALGPQGIATAVRGPFLNIMRDPRW
jgi:beta-glucosidase-like glycosyl hydrolase